MPKGIVRKKEFELPVYSARVVFIYGNSFEEIAKIAEEDNLDPKDIDTLKKGKYRGYCFDVEDDDKIGKSNTYVVILKDKDKYTEINSITHEILHAVVFILESRGLKFNKQNEEAYTYLTGYLNSEFFKFRDGK